MQAAGRQRRRTKAGGLAARTIAQCDGARPACECPVCQPMESSQRRRSHGQGQRARARAQVRANCAAGHKVGLFASWWSHRKGAGLTARVAGSDSSANSRQQALCIFYPERDCAWCTHRRAGCCMWGAALGLALSPSSRVSHSQYVFDHSPKEGPQLEKAFVRSCPPSAPQDSVSRNS